MPRAKRPGSGGRLIFALDATASRQPTWDRAARIQGEMFQEAASLGGLSVQLVFYRGFKECRAGGWTENAASLTRKMTGVQCLAGETQVGRILRHGLEETRKQKVDALIFVGDCFEEDIDHVGSIAGELGLLGLPVFMFHEGGDPIAAFAFQQIAKLSNGAYCRFDAASADMLRELLRAVAVYAAGGRCALENYANKQGGEVRRIAHQVKR
ncbi:MAG: VWA domain-containing protein [Magnetospiraceae bacterium]